jgi:hypothetical protein
MCGFEITNRVYIFASKYHINIYIMSKDKKKTGVSIKCNSVVKKYTMDHLKRLGIDVGLAQLYVNLARDGSTSCKRDSKVVKLSEQLIQLIPVVRPRIPLTAVDINEMTQFITKWKERVSGFLAERQYRPIYLRDVVNSLLSRKSDIKCTRTHLEWSLFILGPDNMNPDKIVETILKFEDEDWGGVDPLAEDDHYSVRLDDKAEMDHKDFRDKVEFIYRFSAPSIGDTLIGQLMNDIDVMREMKKWCGKPHLNCSVFLAEYLEFIHRLQTVSPIILPKKLFKKFEKVAAASKTSNSMDNGKKRSKLVHSTTSKVARTELADTSAVPDKHDGECLSPVSQTEGQVPPILPESVNSNNSFEVHEAKLRGYLAEIAGTDKFALNAINEPHNQEAIKNFAEHPAFSSMFKQLEDYMKEGKRFPSYALRKIRELLDENGK